ncbi:MAG: SurA N-terminal domain-containing protein [Planctomycetes bacterium]|nr:SurA N-terminal domain-containing protein [Planctomycetota bacterium]
MRVRVTHARVALWLALLAPGCSTTGEVKPEGPPFAPAAHEVGSNAANAVLATVNDQVITRRELEVELRFDEEYQRLSERHAGDELERLRAAHRSQVVEDLITQQVLLQRARKDGIQLDADDRRRVEERIAGFSSRYGSRENLGAELARHGLSLDGLRAKIEGNLLMRKFEALRLRRTSYVAPDEIRACYRALEAEVARTGGVADPLFRERCYRERRLVLRQVRVSVERRGRADAQIHMDNALGELARGLPFEEVARRYGDGPEREQGGEGSVAGLEDLPGPVAEAVRPLEVGGTTPVVEHGGFLVVARVEARDPARLLTFQEAQGVLKDLLRVRKLDGVLAEWHERLCAQAYIQRFAE